MFAILLILSGGLAQDDWYTFEPGSKDNRVGLPSKPEETPGRSVTGAAGRMQITTARVEAADGVYSVQVTEGPARVSASTLDEGIRRFAASKKATLGPLQAVTVGGEPGREFEMTEGPKRSKWRFVVSGKSLFVLSASGMPGAGVPAEADRFLTSLEIGPPTATVAAATAPPAKPDAAEAEAARAELARAKQEAEFAKAKAEEEIARAKADAEAAKAKAEAEIAKAKAEFSDKPDASVAVDDAEKGDDDPKVAAKAPAKKSNGPVKVTIGRMPKDAKPYAAQDVEDVSRSFARDRDGFRDVGPQGSVLVGVRVTFIERFGGPKVRSAQPIYRSGKNHYAGRIYGQVFGPAMTVVARPGYAVGGLVTHAGLTLDGFGIVFMKVDGDHLDPTDTYNSPWIGDRNGGSPGESATRGGLVVGLQGRSQAEVNALGLATLK